MVGATLDANKIQILAPNTLPHSQILQNSYVSELDLSQISEQLDIEMAVMLDPQEAIKETTASQNSQAAATEPAENANGERAAANGTTTPPN